MTIERVKASMVNDARIAAFEQSIKSIDKSLIGIENRFDKMDSKFERINDVIFSHFKWTVMLIFGIYASTIGTLLGAVGKAYHWF